MPENERVKNLSTDAVFDLVHQLSDREKDIVKRRLPIYQADEPILLRLYEEILKAEEWDEAAMCEVFPKNLANHKNRLWQTILIILQILEVNKEEDKDPEVELYNLFMNARLLLKRQLPEQAMVELSRAKKLCREKDFYYSMGVCIYYDALINNYLPTANPRELIPRILKEFKENTESLRQYGEAYMFWLEVLAAERSIVYMNTEERKFPVKLFTEEEPLKNIYEKDINDYSVLIAALCLAKGKRTILMYCNKLDEAWALDTLGEQLLEKRDANPEVKWNWFADRLPLLQKTKKYEEWQRNIKDLGDVFNENYRYGARHDYLRESFLLGAEQALALESNTLTAANVVMSRINDTYFLPGEKSKLRLLPVIWMMMDAVNAQYKLGNYDKAGDMIEIFIDRVPAPSFPDVHSFIRVYAMFVNALRADSWHLQMKIKRMGKYIENTSVKLKKEGQSDEQIKEALFFEGLLVDFFSAMYDIISLPKIVPESRKQLTQMLDKFEEKIVELKKNEYPAVLELLQEFNLAEWVAKMKKNKRS